MTEQLTSLEIEQWRRTVFERSAWFHAEVLRALEYMLQLHDIMTSLRNLQAEDVTEEQRSEWMQSAWQYNENQKRTQRDMIAAAVRVMLGGDT